jgi:hypothetical protein
LLIPTFSMHLVRIPPVNLSWPLVYICIITRRKRVSTNVSIKFKAKNKLINN